MYNINKLITDYSIWLRDEITVNQFGEYYELTTPFLDRFNDYLQIYVRIEKNGSIILTDDGYIISNLISSGVSLRKDSYKEMQIERIIRNYSLNHNGDQIVATATEKTFPQKKHALVQAMLAIDDLYETDPRAQRDFFVDDAKSFFDKKEIYYSHNITIIGKTGTDCTYDFLFQKNRTKPERFCNAINRLSENKRNMTIFNWIDTKEQRQAESELIILLNDEDNPVSDNDIEALKNYDIYSALFSRRDKEETVDMFR